MGEVGDMGEVGNVLLHSSLSPLLNETLTLSFKRYFTDFFHLPRIVGKARGTEEKSKTKEE